jgi:hypothetical protein
MKATQDSDFYVTSKATLALWEIANFYTNIKRDASEDEQKQAQSALQSIRNNSMMEKLCRAKDQKLYLSSRHLEEIATEALVKFCSVDTVIFGQVLPQLSLKTYLLNPDVIKLTIPLSKLTTVIVDTETYNFHQVERFITYAINYIGKKYLKKNVEVQIYGDHEKLHQNLKNLFNNLFKIVKFSEV